MTRDEARALIAGEVAAGRIRGNSAVVVADAVLDALFAQGDEERRYADPNAALLTLPGDRVQVRRVVFVSDEWRDETDG